MVYEEKRKERVRKRRGRREKSRKFLSVTYSLSLSLSVSLSPSPSFYQALAPSAHLRRAGDCNNLEQPVVVGGGAEGLLCPRTPLRKSKEEKRGNTEERKGGYVRNVERERDI